MSKNWTIPWHKWKSALINPSLLFEFQTCTIKLLAYNYVLTLLIANQDVKWKYEFQDDEFANRFGHELIVPKISTKFGFFFRVITVLCNTLAIQTLLDPTRKKSTYLLPAVIWNFYMITAITENMVEIIWTMWQLGVNVYAFGTICLVGVFIISFQSKLTLRVLGFFEYLNSQSV